MITVLSLFSALHQNIWVYARSRDYTGHSKPGDILMQCSHTSYGLLNGSLYGQLPILARRKRGVQ